jgi:transcriptional regulator with PAS, ATPase and Fis domain
MRVGGTAQITVDFRLVAATNRDLGNWVEQGRFRQDLFFRINVFSITIPPLRERRKDILPLADFFLRQFALKLNRKPGPWNEETRELLLSYSWPGNVRELQNEIERLVLLSEAGIVIGPELLSEHICQRSRAVKSSDGDLKMAVRDLEDEIIRKTMAKFNQNKSRTARALGISRQSLLDKLRRVEIEDSKLKIED